MPFHILLHTQKTLQMQKPADDENLWLHLQPGLTSAMQADQKQPATCQHICLNVACQKLVGQLLHAAYCVQ